MNVEQLIEELKKHDPKQMVVVPGLEGGYSEVENIIEIGLLLNVYDKWYYGRHEQDSKSEYRAIVIV